MASGLALSIALQTPGHWVAAWIGLVPLFIAIRGSKPGAAALSGFIAGAVYYGIILYWMTLFGHLPWALVVAYQALYFAAFGMFSAYVLRRRDWRVWIAIPSAWVILQYIRTLGPYAFIWGSFAHTQAQNLPIAQLASVTGSWGIDFLVCLANVAIAETMFVRAGRRCVPLVFACIVVAAVTIFGVAAMRSNIETLEAPRVAIIQGNMKNDFDPAPDYVRKSYERYSRMTAEAASLGPAIVIWPETTLPTPVTSPGWADSIARTAAGSRVEILAGGYDPSRNAQRQGSYNTLFHFNKQGRQAGAYHKVQLVPFGEFVPLRDRLPMLKNYPIRQEDVLAARSHALLNTSIGKIGVSICFESLFPEIARTETFRGANVLCVVTNDAWFGRTQAAREHLLMAKLRAIENHRYVLRAAGTGISAVIDPCGRTQRQIGLFKQGTLLEAIVPEGGLTPYTRLGQWFVYLCFAALTLCLAAPRASKASA